MCVWWGGGRGRRGAGEWSLSVFLRGEMEGFPNSAGFCKRNILSFFFIFFICLGSLCNARENRELLPYVFKRTKKKKKKPNFL